VAGAVSLHLVAFGIIDGASPESRRVHAPHSVEPARVDARLIRVIAAPLAAQPSLSSNEASHPDATRRPAPAPSKPALLKEEAQTPAPVYLESGALDRTAEPVGEWALDTSLLPLNGESSFQVAIWVSARGEIEKWEVTSASTSEEQAAAIFSRLNDTVMNPALIGTQPVASVLRFELRAERQ